MGVKKEKTKSEFTLPDEVVTVKYIKRRKGMAASVDENHVISGGMLTNSKRKFSAPLQRNGSIANILTAEEKEYLEGVLGINLSVYGDFWTNQFVTLHKDDASNKFDLSDPMSYIQVRLLESLGETIAKDWSTRNHKQTYQFAITREDEIPNEKKAKLDNKKLAFKLYGKIEDDKDKLLGVLKLLSNQPISKDSKLNWVQGKVEEYVDTMPTSFINVVNDASFDTKVLINNATDVGIILRNGNKYRTADGLDLSNSGQIPTFDNAVTYLDNPKNQEVRNIIEAKLDKVK